MHKYIYIVITYSYFSISIDYIHTVIYILQVYILIHFILDKTEIKDQ